MYVEHASQHFLYLIAKVGFIIERTFLNMHVSNLCHWQWGLSHTEFLLFLTETDGYFHSCHLIVDYRVKYSPCVSPLVYKVE